MISRSFIPDRTSRALSVEVGKHMFGLSLFRPSRQSNPSPRRARVGRREIQISPPPGEQDYIGQMPYPRANKDNQIPTPYPATLSAGFTLIGA